MAHVITTMSGLEKHAASELSERYSLQSYLPLVRTSRVIAGRVVVGAEPLFRRYLFLLNLTCQWRAVLETRGVMSFLFPTAEDGPEFVRDSVVEEIRSREDADGFVPVEVKPVNPEAFVRDQSLRVLRGPLAGKVVTHSGLTIGKREFVFLNMLGRQRIEFDHSDLVVMPARPAETEKRRRRRKRGTRAERENKFHQSNTPAFLARTTQSSSIPAA